MLNSKHSTSVAIGIVLFCLSGCFSHVPFKDAPKPYGNGATVYIYRPDSPPHLRKATVLVNDQKIGDLASDEFTWIALTPGAYIFHVKWAPDLFISTENINLQVRDKESTFVKIDPYFLPGNRPQVAVRLSSGTHPDQITEVWPLKYVTPNELTVTPLQ